MHHQYSNSNNRFENIRTPMESRFGYKDYSNKNPLLNHRKRPHDERQYPSTESSSGDTRYYHSSRRFDNPNRYGTTMKQPYLQQNLYCTHSNSSNRLAHEQIQQAPSYRDNVYASSSSTHLPQTNYNGNGSGNHLPERNNYSTEENSPKIEVTGIPYENRLLDQVGKQKPYRRPTYTCTYCFLVLLLSLSIYIHKAFLFTSFFPFQMFSCPELIFVGKKILWR